MSNKKIFVSVINANPCISYRDLMEITGKAENTVFYWLREERGPDELSLVLIKEALDFAGMNIPIRLERFCDEVFSRPANWWKGS